MRTTGRWTAVVTVLLATASACSDQGPEDGLREEVEANRARWLALRPARYEYDLERLCFCTLESRGPVTVSVDGGQVVGRVYTVSGDTVPSDVAGLFPALDGLFDVLLDALDREAHEIRVEWDAGSGAPLDIWIDYLLNVADEELGFRIVGMPRGAS